MTTHQPGVTAPIERTEMIDLNTTEMTRRFSDAKVYVKSAVVTIVEVDPGTVVRTILTDGTDETTNIAAEDRRHLVTNPGGEEYLIDGDTLSSRYDRIGGDTYRARGMVRAFRNSTGAPVTILAPWGAEQHGCSDCMFATTVDPARPDEIGADRYLIGAAEFADTYVEANA